MTGRDENYTIQMPPDLFAQAREVADQEHRTADDLIREAVERYLNDRRWNRLIAYGHDQARKAGLTEQDVPHLIAEYRRERRRAE